MDYLCNKKPDLASRGKPELLRICRDEAANPKEERRSGEPDGDGFRIMLDGLDVKGQRKTQF